VVALGDGVTGLAVGDRVLGGAVLPYGGFGELTIMDAATTFPGPEALDDAQAASLYIGCQTGWFGLPPSGTAARGAPARARRGRRCRQRSLSTMSVV